MKPKHRIFEESFESWISTSRFRLSFRLWLALIEGSTEVENRNMEMIETFQNEQAGQRIDFVRELRLRQWARQNFVPGEQRKSTWHPVVLDEMRNRDRELAAN
jgi:hypothetical protein